MQIIKKVTALILALSLCLIPFNAVSAYSRNDDFSYTDFLTDLEIYTADDNMMYEDDTITREEAASILSVFYGVTESSFPVKGVAEDVPENWSSGHISTVVNAGVMSLYDDGLFRPDEFMKVGDVIKMFVVLTGYKVVAENNGGFPTGYLMTAFKNGIVKNVSDLDLNAEITKGEFSKLLYNTLKVKILRQSSYSTEHNVFNSETGVTLLSENLDVYEDKGLVNALPHTSIDYSTPSGENNIKIGNTEYEYLKDASEYLATNVKFYYRQADDDAIGRVLHMEIDEEKTKIIDVDADDIEKTTLTSVTYVDKNKSETVYLPKNVVVIFNGVRNTYYTAQHLKPLQGSVRIIDADKNGVYDYVIVESYINYFVQRTEFSGSTVYITEQSGKNAIKLDVNDADVYISVFDRDREIGLNGIKSGDVLSVMANMVDLDKKEIKQGSTFIKMYRSDNRVTGKITSIGKDYIMIDDTKYELAGDFDKNEYGIKIGEANTFCLNWIGKISAYDEAKSETRYAILQKAKARTAIDDVTQLRLFDEGGSFIIAECSDRIQIDGYGKTAYKNVVDYLKKSSERFAAETELTLDEGSVWQLVKYSLNNEGKVNQLDTVMPDNISSEKELKFFDRTVSGKSSSWLETAGCLKSESKRFGVSPSTLIFTVGTDKMSDGGYAVKTSASFAPGSSTVTFFDANDMNVSKAAIWFLSGNSLSVDSGESQDLMIVEEIINELNSDGISAVFLKGVQLDTGNNIEVELSSEDLILTHKIIPGSFVRWNADSSGSAAIVENSMTINGNGTVATAANPTGGFSLAVRFSYGKAAAMDDEFIKLRFNGTDEAYQYDEPWMLDDLKYVYIFDVENEKLEKGSINDVRTIEEYGNEEADTIAGYYRWGGLKTMIIYR